MAYGNPRPPFNMFIAVTIGTLTTLAIYIPFLFFTELTADDFKEWYETKSSVLLSMTLPIHFCGWLYIVCNYVFHEIEIAADERKIHILYFNII